VPEEKILLKNCGIIDPGNITTSLEQGGFEALAKAREQMTPKEVIDEVKASGLRGRGGAGFPCGLKWELAAESPGEGKYLICNADEGEMGTFKDRYVIQNDPFSLIEGMAIAAYAIGAPKAYVYLRAEYHFLRATLDRAIRQTEEKGFLKGIHFEVREGAGAYVCGEETALMNSIEGVRGESRYRPPFPPTRGLWGRPTIINNVETLMNIPALVLNGAAWYRKFGTEKSKGTKLFSVSGDVKNPGVYELPMGCELKELVLDLAGAKDVQTVLVGGAAGRFIPGDKMDIPLCYETALGSGAVMVFNHNRNIIDIVHGLVRFMAEESCGKCAPCREGTEVMVEVLERLARGEGRNGDVETLEKLSAVMIDSALCGLGQGCPVPVLDSLNLFRMDYMNRIDQSVYLRRL
jgi:NADH:ubiquinone oxidoreductase subunit F (NADH-binding)